MLVHCHAGVSRSATICLAYLITCHNVTLSDAFRYVKHRRNVISPNFNFMGQLLKLENDVAARKSAAVQVEKAPKFDFTLARVEEIENQNENENCLTKKTFKPTLVMPFKPITNNNAEAMEHPSKLCLTAPPRIKEFNFFPEPSLSCSRQISRFDKHHIKRHSRTLTLST